MISPVAEVIEFRAMNTEWWITTHGGGIAAALRGLASVEPIVRDAEAAFSRFRPDSLVSRLNSVRRIDDRGLADLVRLALRLGERTDGAFDIRVGPALVAAGYDRSFEALPAVVEASRDTERAALLVEALTVRVEGSTVCLDGPGAIDLGGIAKGWTVDRVADSLEAAGCHNYLVDGGGDIRTGGSSPEGGPWPVGVGAGLAVAVSGRAVCTSSIEKRRWRTAAGEAHHVIDPRRGAPADHGVTNVVTVGFDAATADALATALIASPDALGAALALGVEVMLERNGTWEMTPGINGLLV